MVDSSKFRRGMSVVEIVIATAILLLAVTGLLTAYNVFVRVGTRTLGEVQSSYLLEEGVEAVSSIRDAGWTANIASLDIWTPYYLVWEAGRFKATTTVSKIDNLYTRSIIVSTVTRDSNDDIVITGASDDYLASDEYVPPSGTIDPNIRKITVYVSWPSGTKNNRRSLSVYLTNLFKN